jgi:hypothetical protein
MRYAKTPMAAAEVGRGAATLSMLAEKAQPAVQALHMQAMREDFLKGQMQYTQGKTYSQIRESGASWATVSGAAALQAQKVMNDAFLEGMSAITQEDHQLTPEQYSEKLGEISKSLFTGDQIVDDFMTELASTNVMKLAEAQTLAHEEWKVQETKSAGRDFLLSTSSMQDEQSDAVLANALGVVDGPSPKEPGNIDIFNRPRVQNADGSISTVRSMSVNIDGEEVLIPTVSPDGNMLSDKQAVDLYRETGQHLGKFNTPEDATEYAHGLHNQQDTFYTSALGSLNRQDQKEVILEAAVLDLKQGNRKIIDKLGGIHGVRERFSTTAAEESALLSAFSEFQSAKENEYSAEMQSDLMDNYRAVRTGAITFEQGLANGAVIAERYGKGNKTLKAISSDLWGAANIYMNKVDADRERALNAQQKLLEKANEDYMKQAELLATADHAINTNSMYTLDAKEKAVAFQRIRNKIDADLRRDVADGTVPIDGISKEAITRMAKAVDRYGVVDDEQAAFSTAAFNTNLVSNEKGEVYAGVMQAYLSLAPLYDINPALALKHLKTDAAKSMFVMARELDLSTDLNEGEAIKQAAANSRQDIDMSFTNKFFGTSFDDTMRDIARSKVEGMAPSLNPFTTTKRGSVMEISTWELDRAAKDPKFLNQVTRLAKRHWMKNTGLTPEQAGELAMREVQTKAAYVVGNVLLPDGDDELHKVMGMPEYTTETGAPHEAVVEFLKERGPELFGEQWFDTEIATRGDGAFMGYLGTNFSQLYRDVPEMNVELVKGRDGYTLFMQPMLNDGSFGAAREVPASQIGEFYKQWRDKEVKDAPVDTGRIDPLNTM